MDTNFLKTVFILIAAALLSADSPAQDNNVMGSACADVSAQQTIPTTGTIKALIIYVKLRGDEFENGMTYDWPHLINGHADERPEWTEYMLTKTLNDPDFEPSISGYYKSMSFSNFRIIGDVYPQGQEYPKLYLTQFSYDHYYSLYCHDTSHHFDISTVVWEAITNLDNEIDYSKYDNDQDGYVDELIVWFRLGYFGSTDCSPYNGVSRLTGVNHIYFIDENGNSISEITTNDGVKIRYSSGLLADGPGRNAVDVMVHEIGHTMGFSGHCQHVGKWNMMGALAGVGIMNTYERGDFFNWLPEGSVTVINTPGTYNINLTDFETTGKAYKLIAQGRYYVLENRSGISFYSRAGSWVMPGNGLLITRNQCTTIESADHKWIWDSNPGANCSPCDNTTLRTYNPEFIRLYPSNDGNFDIELHGVCTTNGCMSYINSSGNAGDLYNVNYNQVFSTWSNPNCMYGPNSNPIVVELIRKNSDSSVDLKIKYDVSDAHIGTSPSKPMWVRATPYYFDPIFEHKFHPQLEWYFNSEPDMNEGNAKYVIYRGGPVTGFDEEPSSYGYLAEVPYDQNTYTDETVTLYDGGSSLGCEYQPVSYWYKIVAVDNESLESVMSEHGKIGGWYDPCEERDNFVFKQTQKPDAFKLFYNYPNPFNPTTMIKYAIPQNAFVKITVYDILGREITKLTNEYKTEGYYEVRFDGTNLASGLYFYRIEAGPYVQTRKMLLLK
jgi:M6 family metalloprotease-like protein